MDAKHRRMPSAYTLLWAVAAVGLATHLAGLAVDYWLHDQDPTLAAREGVFTLSNPGHALIFAGLALMAASIAGSGAHWLLRRPAFEHGLRREVASAAMLVAVAGVSIGGVLLTAADRDSTHQHGTGIDEDHGHAEELVAASAPSPATSAQGSEPEAAGQVHTHDTTAAEPGASMSEENAHFHHAEVAVSEEHLRAALAFVDEVRAATANYEHIRVALANGYVQVTQDLPGIAAHFARLDYLHDGVELDPSRPEVLLYSKRLDGTWRFLGVMFQSEEATPEPPNFFGGLDSWHYHTNLCFTAGRAGATVRVVESADDCPAPQTFQERTPWELHVWTLSGAAGPFSHDYAPIDPGPYPPATQPAALELGLVRSR